MEKYEIGDKVWIIYAQVCLNSYKITSSIGKYGGNNGPVLVKIISTYDFKDFTDYKVELVGNFKAPVTFEFTLDMITEDTGPMFLSNYSEPHLFKNKEEAVEFWNAMIQNLRDDLKSEFETDDEYLVKKINKNGKI